MTIQGHIKWDEGQLTTARGADDTGQIRYWVHSDDTLSETRTDAVDWLAINAPQEFNGMIQNKISVTARVSDTTNTAVTEQIWDAVVEYIQPEKAKPKPLPEGDDSAGGKTSFRLSIRSTSGESKTQTVSRALIDAREAGPEWEWSGEPPGQLLGLEMDNSSESGGTMFVAKGISVPIGGIELVVEKRFENTFLIGPTFETLADLAEYAGKNVVNTDNWKGFAAGTLKFTSFECTQDGGKEAATGKNEESWVFNYTFGYSPTITKDELNALPDPPGMAGVDPWTEDKKGWHLLDNLWVDGIFERGAMTFKMPEMRRQSIQQIFEEISFTDNLHI